MIIEADMCFPVIKKYKIDIFESYSNLLEKHILDYSSINYILK